MIGPSRLLFALTLVAVSAWSDAHAALITFDDRPTGFTSQDTYQAEGVHFLSVNSTIQPGMVDSLTGQFLIQASDRAVSPPNIALGAVPNPPSSPFFHDLVGRFFLPGGLPGESTLPATTNSLSFWVVATMPGQTTAPWTVAIFGRGKDTFDEVNNQRLEVITGTSDKALVSFSHPVSDIAGFLLLSSSNREGIDDVNFATPSVPEPSTIALVGIVLIVVSLRKRRLACWSKPFHIALDRTAAPPA